MNKDEQNKILKQIDEVDWKKIKSIFNTQWSLTLDELLVTFKNHSEAEDLMKSICWIYFTTGLQAALIYMNGMAKMQNDWANGMQEKIKSDFLSEGFKKEMQQ